MENSDSCKYFRISIYISGKDKDGNEIEPKMVMKNDVFEKTDHMAARVSFWKLAKEQPDLDPHNLKIVVENVEK